MKHYTINYYLHGSYEDPKTICVMGMNKEDAYDRAVYEEIPKIENYSPYSVWVAGVTYNNGNYKAFNTSSGNPF